MKATLQVFTDITNQNKKETEYSNYPLVGNQCITTDSLKDKKAIVPPPSNYRKFVHTKSTNNLRTHREPLAIENCGILSPKLKIVKEKRTYGQLSKEIKCNMYFQTLTKATPAKNNIFLKETTKKIVMKKQISDPSQQANENMNEQKISRKVRPMIKWEVCQKKVNPYPNFKVESIWTPTNLIPKTANNKETKEKESIVSQASIEKQETRSNSRMSQIQAQGKITTKIFPENSLVTKRRSDSEDVRYEINKKYKRDAVDLGNRKKEKINNILGKMRNPNISSFAEKKRIWVGDNGIFPKQRLIEWYAQIDKNKLLTKI